MSDFTQYNLDDSIIKGIEALGFTKPTPIQQEAIPAILAGEDLIGIAKTGSGKTSACAIPCCQLIDPDLLQIQALVIVPTRELAFQYGIEAHNIGKYKKVKSFSIYGGENASLQKTKLKSGVHFLIATPGKLIDFIYSRDIDLSHVKVLIIDEADEMLSMGFFDDLEFLFQCLNHKHQTLLFSATMPKEIRLLSKNYLNNPKEISLVPVGGAQLKIDHHFHYCSHFKRDDALIHLINQCDTKQVMVFCHSRIQCENVCKFLRQHLKGVEYLHAGIAQDMRNRITDKFRLGKIKYLVATDLASRGLDFSDVTHVFIYQLSDDPDIYVHRSGRTGRQDKSGTVVTLVTKREVPVIRKIVKNLKTPALWIGEPPNLEEKSPSSRKPYPKRKGPAKTS